MLVPPLPTQLQVEVTGSCNLSCQMCLVSYRPRLGRSASLSLDTFRALLDDLGTIERVTLQGLGEPLLAPDLEAMIAEAVARGIAVGFNTNGMLLHPERSARLVELGVDWIHVSVDAASPVTFARIRRGGRLETVLENLRGLVAARAAAGASRPTVQMNTVVMNDNLDELADIVRLAAEIGVDRLWLQGLSHGFDDVSADPAFDHIRVWTDDHRCELGVRQRRLDEARAVADRLGLPLRVPEAGDERRQPGEPACDWPWRGVYVGQDGGVQPCCMLMGADRGRLGNIHDVPVSALWRQPDYVQLRAGLLGDEPPSICRGCSAYKRTF